MSRVFEHKNLGVGIMKFFNHFTCFRNGRWTITWLLATFLIPSATVTVLAQAPAYPPQFPDGKHVITILSGQMLRSDSDLVREDVVITQTAPKVDLFFFPGQDYAGNPWSNWGDVSYADGRFYATIDDHLSPRGSSMIYVYDPDDKEIRMLANVRRFLETGDGSYVTSIEVDPTGWYLYYVPGAHGNGILDGTPVIQYDLQTNTPKVLAFMHPVIYDQTGYAPDGTFGLALDEAGERLFINWNGNRANRAGWDHWDASLGMVIHIPETERLP